MLSFVKLLIVLQPVSVWSAPAVVHWVPVLVTQLVQTPPIDFIQEMAALAKLYQQNSHTQGQQSMDLMSLPEGLQNFLPSSITDRGVFLNRLKYNFDQPTNTKQTPQEDETRKQIPQNGDIDSVVIDANDSTEKVQNNLLRKGVVAPLEKQRLSIGSIISSLPFLPYEINVPDQITWLYNFIINIINGNRNRAQTSSALRQEQMQRILLERILNNSGIPLEFLLRSKGAMQTISPYQTVLPLPVD